MATDPSLSAIEALHIVPCTLGERCEALRTEVRAFLAEELADYPPVRRAESWVGADEAFSRKLGARGWIGMTWPRRYGGAERSALERYVVIEELLAAGAPVGAHWIADRQSGPMLMRFARDTLAPRILPGVARGETYFCIGMSEPGAGSDLASVRTRARPAEGGWVIDGSKLWTTGAHRAHYMIAFVRTDGAGADRHAGFSQFLVDMRSPGVRVRPIVNLLGEQEFNEVFLDGVWVPEENLIGRAGDGWQQVTSELALERSGPERYMSSTQLLLEMLDAADPRQDREAVALGRLVADYATLRQMSIGVAGMLARGENPAIAAAVVKDQGANLEQGIPEIAFDLFGDRAQAGDALADVMSYVNQAAPSFSLRGGTREILRGIVARGMGLR
jgi:acyl-CoA dehydrogenase